MATQAKDVIYIDIDDEITAIIDKLRSAESRIVALVLPKRATVFQSSVNMKLLKKAADESKKRLVLITSENNLLPLAGSIGLYVAKNLQSKPEIPVAPDSSVAETTIDTVEEPETEESSEDFNQQAAATQPVGTLAGLDDEPKIAKPELMPMPIPRSEESDDSDDTIEMDNTPATVPDDTDKPEKVKKSKNKDLKVPNFNKFRNRLIIAVLVLILLIVGWVIANQTLPKATITITSQSSSVNSNLTLNLSTAASTVNQSSLTVPAHVQQTQKTISQQVATTGQLNKGTVATGSVQISGGSCSALVPSDIPAGTGVSSNGLTYITQVDTTFIPVINQKKCTYQGETTTGSSNIGITAQNPGASYNVSDVSFTVANDPSVSATGSASGGTDNIVQVVTQTDINNATSKLTAPDTSAIKTELQNDLTQAGYYPIPATFSSGTPTTANSANPGDQANDVTVTQTTTYTMFGVHQSDLQALLDNYINSQIDSSKQSILNDGVSQATFSVLNQSPTTDQVSMQATGSVGLHLDVASLKTQVAGKKAGQVQSIVDAYPGVTSVNVNLSPFWVSSVPNKTSKITIVLQSASHAKST